MNATKTATRTLVATQQEVPARITTGKIKRVKNPASGQYIYTVEVLIDGKRVGEAVDEGNGGGIWFRNDTFADRAVEAEVQEEYRVLLGREEGRHSHETLYNALVEEWETTRDLNRGLAKKTPSLKGLESLRTTVDEGHGFTYETCQWLTIGAPLAQLQRDREIVIKQTGITHVWNGTEWVAL